jgi:peptidoglycan/xylan/chitin deacetylase (PgdA/CDA1 family)
MNDPVAVLMYHSIAPFMDGWVFKHLSVGPDLFEDQMATLKRKGYVTITLKELYEYVTGRTRLPRKAIVITFDDGYLDNWVFAFPTLKRHGMKGTVFVSTDFIDRRDEIRPNLEDVWKGRVGHRDLHYRGFLSVPEMRRMLMSQLVDIQGHCKTHTWYPVSGKVVDFHHPGSPYPWLAWNARTDRKPHYMEEDQDGLVPLGAPVYEHRESLVARRYFPEPGPEAEIERLVESRGGRAFFEEPGWRSILFERMRAVAGEAVGGRHETEAERLTRLKDEIVLSREELSALLDHPVDFLCWPGGAYDDGCVDMAREAGYMAWTLRSRDRLARQNVPGEDPAWIRRLDVSPGWYRKGRKVCPLDGDFLAHMIAEYKGFFMAGLRFKCFKAGRLFAGCLRRGRGG